MRKVIYLGSFFFSLSLLLSCQPKLERENIPVWAGMTVDENCEVNEVGTQMETLKAWDLSGLSIEIPLEANPREISGDFKYYEAHPIDTLIIFLQQSRLPYSISFDLRNPRHTSLKSIDWKKQFTQISGILLRTADYPPVKIVFMGELVDPELPNSLLSEFVQQIKTDFQPFKGEIVFAYFPEVLNDSIDFQTPDLIGIRYHQSPDESLIPFYRKTNQMISQKLIEWQKKGLIVQTNLLGDDKDDQFRYQLRYWDEKAEIEGLYLNTLYCELALMDEESFFSLGGDGDFQKYLKQYLK